MTPEERCADIEARVAKATPGPWVWNDDPSYGGWRDRGPNLVHQPGTRTECPAPGCMWIEDGHERSAAGQPHTHRDEIHVLGAEGYDAWGVVVGDADKVFIAHAREDLSWAIAEIRRLRQWVHDLQAGMYINCVYCGHRYGPDDQVPATMAQALKEHVERCPEHPMAALREERDRLRTAMEDEGSWLSSLLPSTTLGASVRQSTRPSGSDVEDAGPPLTPAGRFSTIAKPGVLPPLEWDEEPGQ